MAESVNFNMTQSQYASEGIIIHEHEGNSDKVIHSWLITNGSTYEIVAPVSLNGLKTIFPEMNCGGQDIDAVRARFEALTKANTPT